MLLQKFLKNYMYKVSFILLITFLLSCNNKVDNKSIPSDTTLIKPESNGLNTVTPKTYKINGFMSFNEKTTFQDVSLYFTNKNINFIASPNTPSLDELNKYEWPGIWYNFKYQFPIGEFIFVPELYIEDLYLKRVLFGFYNNVLSFICIGANANKASMDNLESIDSLKVYYKKKYGEGTKSKAENSFSKDEVIDYYSDSTTYVHVQFLTTIPSYESSNIKFSTRYLISFTNYMQLYDACRLINNKSYEVEQKLKKDKEKKYLIIFNNDLHMVDVFFH